MNLIEGQLKLVTEQALFTKNGLKVKAGEIGLSVLKHVKKEEIPVTLGFRPESIRLVDPELPNHYQHMSYQLSFSGNQH